MVDETTYCIETTNSPAAELLVGKPHPQFKKARFDLSHQSLADNSVANREQNRQNNRQLQEPYFQ
jgi:hypothetical protein